MRVIKKIFSFIWLSVRLILIAVILVAVIGLIGYDKTGRGIKYLNFDAYKTIIFSLKDNNYTLSIGDYPLPDEIRPGIRHKDNDWYFDLNHNEQIIYDSVVTRGFEIIENERTDTVINIPLDDMEFDGLTKETNYESAKKIINETISTLNYEKVFKYLHKDYDYLMWWEYNQLWEVSEATIFFNSGELKDSSFILSLGVAEWYRDENFIISSSKVEEARAAYTNAKEVAKQNPNSDIDETLNYFRGYVLNNTEYDNIAAENIISGIQTEDVANARNFISVFDNKEDTLSVCGGYSVAFQLLCDLSEIDVDCYKVNGSVKVDTVASSHTWNKVVKNGNYYLVDLTNSEESAIGHFGGLYMKQIDDSGIYSANTGYSTCHYTEQN